MGVDKRALSGRNILYTRTHTRTFIAIFFPGPLLAVTVFVLHLSLEFPNIGMLLPWLFVCCSRCYYIIIIIIAVVVFMKITNMVQQCT